MSCGTQVDLEICQGATFQFVFRWRRPDVEVFKAITNVTAAAPAIITAVGHGLASGWEAQAEGFTGSGMKELEALGVQSVTVLTADTLYFNGVNAAKFTPYTSGGYLRYKSPVPLSGYDARMTIKDKIGGTVLDTLTVSNGKIVLSSGNNTIKILLLDTATAAYTWSQAVYDLEMIEPGTNYVYRPAYGSIVLSNEVTT